AAPGDGPIRPCHSSGTHACSNSLEPACPSLTSVNGRASPPPPSTPGVAASALTSAKPPTPPRPRATHPRRQNPSKPPPPHPPHPALLPVRRPATPAAVELLLSSGAVLRVPVGCDPTFVRSLLQALGDLPC